MIGASVQRRSSRQTSVPRPSGRSRSRMIASGGWSAAALERLLGRRRRRDVVAGARAGSSAARAGTAARRRRRAPAAPVTPGPAGQLDERQREHERGALPVARLEPQPAAVRLGEPARDRQPETGAGLVRLPVDAVERLEDPLSFLLGDPGAAIGHADEHLLPRRGDPHVDGLARRRDAEARSRAG